MNSQLQFESEIKEFKPTQVVAQQKQSKSFWGFICPCFFSNQKNNKNQKSTYVHRQFYEESTIHNQTIHEETEFNLHTHAKHSQFKSNQILLNLEFKTQNQQHIKGQLPTQNQLTIFRFNVKKSRKNSHQYSNGIAVSTNLIENKQNRKTISKLNASQGLAAYNRAKINHQQLINIQKQLQKMEGFTDHQFIQNWQQFDQNHYPINSLEQNKLILLGSHSNKLLAKITSVKLFPSKFSIEQYNLSLKNKALSLRYGRKPEANPQLDRYWGKRYFLFQRFDEGIQLDEDSWFSATPQAVSDYISSKINIKNTILDAFCGAGGDSIKLSISCRHLIANDINQKKIKCLLNNAKIYGVSNITAICSDFFDLNCKVDAVYLAPPWGVPDCFKIKSFHPELFEPKLSKIIEKAFSLSQNIFFLLPANIDIEQLGAIISKKLCESASFKTESCSLKIQKIYYNKRLQFIIGFFGCSQVQSEIRLGDELSFIYKLLSQGEGIFKYKKLIRWIRQQYGMAKLLNYVFQCQKNQSITNPSLCEEKIIDKFQKYLIFNHIINQKTLDKIKNQQLLQYQYEQKQKQSKHQQNIKKTTLKPQKKKKKLRPFSINHNKTFSQNMNNQNINLIKQQINLMINSNNHIWQRANLGIIHNRTIYLLKNQSFKIIVEMKLC